MPWLIDVRECIVERKGRLSHCPERKQKDNMRGEKHGKELRLIPLSLPGTDRIVVTMEDTY